MLLDGLDTAAMARALAQIADRDEDLTEVYCERREEVELAPEGRAPGIEVRRDEGLAVRLVRGGRSWLACRDSLSADAFGEALRQVARAGPRGPWTEPGTAPGRWEEPPTAEELQLFPAALERALRSRHVAFPLRLSVTRIRRQVQVIGPRVIAAPELERFYSLRAELPWGPFGRLLREVGERETELTAEALTALFRARDAAPPEVARSPLVLAPAAAAVFLHEAVAHALEADTLALGGKPEAAVGIELGSALLHVLDDPAAAPESVRRGVDDEGVPVLRRWLLRAGKVEQPLCDLLAAQGSARLAPGCGWRASRHHPPAPRSRFLELLPGEDSPQELLAAAEGGLYLPEVGRGALDPLTGRLTLLFPHARRIRGGALAEPVGPGQLRGQVADLLAQVAGIGRLAELEGAGWCAKGGQKLAVWACAPVVRLAEVEVFGA